MILYPRLKIPLWVVVWILTRALMIAQVGFWVPDGLHYQDVDLYHVWAEIMGDTGALPTDPTWQYPPGAGLLLLAPQLSPAEFQPSFVVLMLVVDLIGFWMMTRLAKEEGKDVGVWIWLLAMPLLAAIPLLRFDLVPTVIAMGALLVIHRRPGLFGVLVGIGAAIKVWPLFLLFAEWDKKRLLRAAGAAFASLAAVFAITALFLGDPFGFLGHQGGRGLQVESVFATPWQLRQVITGELPPTLARYGSNEIASGLGEVLAKFLDVAAIAVLVGSALWWRLRERRVRGGRPELGDVALSRDFAFTVSLLFVVVSRVLSPQYMIWLVGLCAVVLTSRRTRVARAAWIVVGAVVLTAGINQAPVNFVIRNLALLCASIDAAVVLSLLLLERTAPPAGEKTVARP
jgi:hypothetical protein